MKKYFSIFSILILVVLLISAVSCIYITSPDRNATPGTQDGDNTIPPETAQINPPVVNSFSASPGSIETGQSSTLSWSVSNATSVTIDQGIGGVALNGSRVVSPSSTTVYTLVASNGSISVPASAQVIVSSPAPPTPTPGVPVINTFAVNPATITKGNSTTLSWSTSNATSVSIDQGIGNVAPAGNKSVSPTTSMVYTITASNSSGWVVTQSIALTVNTSGGVFIPFNPGILVAFKPDMIITDVWNDGGTIWYTIKNQGLIDSAATHTDLIIDGAVKATDYSGPLSAGSFRNEKISGYSYTCSGLNDSVTVKADADSESNETDETNNSLSETWFCQLIIEPLIPIFPGP